MNAVALNSMQRTLTALSGREPDRVPLFLLANLHGAKELGVSIEDYFASAEAIVEGELRMLAKFRGDCLYPFSNVVAEFEAWGGESNYSADAPPVCGSPVIRRPAMIDDLLPPAIGDSPSLLRVLEVIETLKRRVGDTVPIIAVAISPFSLPVVQMGFDHYLDLMYEDPVRFDRLMAVNASFTLSWANAQLQAGATAICYFDPVASPSIVPREVYLRTGQPLAHRLMGGIKGPVATHLASGRALPILEDLISTGTGVIGVSADEDLAELKARAAGRVGLLGNLNGIEMRRWTPEQTDAAVQRAIAKAGTGGGFLLSDNHGQIPWQVSDDILLAIAEAVDRWGRYPLNWLRDWDDAESN